MQQYIDWFRASTQYINAHRGKIFVISLSGEALQDDNLDNILYDLCLLHSLGVKLVLVHGARPQIDQALNDAEIESTYHRHLRITQERAVHHIKQVVGGLSSDIEALFSRGLSNTPMHGASITLCRGNFVTAKPVGILDGIDFHYTGSVRKIHATAIKQQLDNENLVLLSNLGYSITGEVFNLSAEEIATETAIALHADKLILFTPKPGVVDGQNKLVKSLTEDDAQFHIDSIDDVASGELACTRAALQAALKAYRNNVHRSHLVSFRENGALIQELFTREGKGSLISSDNFETLRDASINDVNAILELLKPLEADGSLVARSRELIETEFENFKLIELEGTIIACAALYDVDGYFGEVAAVVSHPEYRNRGLANRLVNSLENAARESGLQKLFVLTTVSAHWFVERGYQETSLDQLPQAKKALYNYQRNSKVFIRQL